MIESILHASLEQVAVEEAPKLLDPIQQTIATALRAYVNSPGMNRKDIITAIQKVNVPQPRVYIKALRKAYEAFRIDGQVANLLATVQDISRDAETTLIKNSDVKSPIRREDLKLVCFEYVCLSTCGSNECVFTNYAGNGHCFARPWAQ